MLLSAATFIASYLIGSLPTAYIVVKRKSDIDIRNAGSGNVGTLNAYEVTGTRMVGLIVLAVDLLKGAFAVYAARSVFGSAPELVSYALLGVVVGHCFPVWLGFKGGRGLAPAAGAVLVVAWMFVCAWLICWAIAYLISKNIHVGNIFAIVAVPILAYLGPEKVIGAAIAGGYSLSQFLLVYSLMSAILLIRHADPLRALIDAYTKKEN